MKKFVTLFVLLAFALVPLIVEGGTIKSVQSNQVTIPAYDYIPNPQRDDADEDSVYYEYGFEHGWQEWAGVDLTEVPPQWHLTDNGDYVFEGNSWWCGSEAHEGYDNHWLQYIITPALNLSDYQGDNIRLRFKMWHQIEAPEGAEEFNYDGWDGANVWISENGGEDWVVIAPVQPAYDSDDLFSFGDIWNYGHGTPGWVQDRLQWTDVEFNLSNYDAFNDVRIRWAFCSDDAWSAGDGEEARGILLDDIIITAEDEVIFANNGDEEGDDAEMEFGTGPADGNNWELSQAESHSGDWSAHCPIIADSRQNPLVSPGLEIPSDPWYTWFDFWIRCDTRDDVNEAGNLLDYWYLEISEDSLVWDQVVYDYGRVYTDQNGNEIDNWKDDFHYYGPDTTYNDVIEWKRKLNLTDFGGQTVWLRWRPITDTLVANPEGSGFWIDDFRLNITARRQFDAQMNWVHVPYPTSMDLRTNCWLEISNIGMSELISVRQYYQFDGGRSIPVIPFRGLEAEASREISFILNSNIAFPYAGVISMNTYVTANDDQDSTNDAVVIEKLRVYPEGVWELGYDNRANPLYFRFDQGAGPAVLFTPGEDGIDENFDLNALRFKWFQPNLQEAEATLHIYTNDNGSPGDVLYETDFVVTADDYFHPDRPDNAHVLDLTEIQELKDLNSDFWVWIEMPDGDFWPAITGDVFEMGPEFLGAGHYYSYNGEAVAQMDNQFMINPIIMPAGLDLNLLIVGNETIDFGDVQPEAGLTKKVILMNGGANDVTVGALELSDGMDQIFHPTPSGWEFPLVLKIGDFAFVNVEFTPLEEIEYEAQITFSSDSDAPAMVTVMGVGYAGASAPGDASGLPTSYALGNAYPNPFNSTTVIPFSLPKEGLVNLSIFDLNGRLIADLAQDTYAAGHHQIAFDATGLATGVYIYRLTTANFSASSKVVLVK